MYSRRELLSRSFEAGAALAFAPALLRTPQASGSALIQRAVPSTGELLPVIGLGCRSKGAEDAALEEVLQTLFDRGGRVLDTLHGGPAAELLTGTVARQLGIHDKAFWTTPVSVSIPLLPGHDGPPPKADPAAVRAKLEEKLATFHVSRIDLAQVLVGGDVATHLAVLKELKQEGRVRYIGVTDLAPPPYVKTSAPFYGEVESIMRNEPIDFIGVDYSVGDRRVEERILPLAQERKIGVMAYFPFDRNRIFKRASSTPLPEWAAEFDATTWAQFFLKYVVSHPAVTVARTGTTQAAHMRENIGGGIGRLPDEALRRRMAQLVDALPPTPPAMPPPKPPASQEPAVVVSADVLDRYVGTYTYAAVGTIVTVRRDGATLLVRSGVAPEGPLVARSQTRFAAPWGATIEFQLDGQGKVTGAIVEQGPYRIPLACT